MKRERSVFISVLIALIAIVTACNQDKFDEAEYDSELEKEVTVSFIEQEEKLVWNFPLRHGTPGWTALKTVEEQFNAYNIPDAILKSISAEELVKVCLAYPEWGLMNAYNSRRIGLSTLEGLFNGFRELYKQDDVAKELIKKYNEMDPLLTDLKWTALQQGLYSFQFTKIEMLFNAPSMIDKLDKVDLQNLKETVILKYKMKKELPNIYSLWDLSPIAGICLNIIEKVNPATLESVADVSYFRYYLMTDDILFLDSIVELLEKIEI
jgi:hypothetical protein